MSPSLRERKRGESSRYAPPHVNSAIAGIMLRYHSRSTHQRTEEVQRRLLFLIVRLAVFREEEPRQN